LLIADFAPNGLAPLERKFRWKAGMGKNHEIPSQQKPKWIALDPIPEFLMR
jgi:hypothetical protein